MRRMRLDTPENRAETERLAQEWLKAHPEIQPQQDSRSDRNRNSFITYDNSYFKVNDEDRAICEDMYGDRAQNHDTDLEFHYGWENKLNYDSDGYDDEEDW